MKFLKIIGIFVVIAAAVAAVFLGPDLIGKIISSDPTPTGSPAFQKRSAAISEAFADNKDFSIDTYKNLMKDIDVSRNNRVITSSEHATLHSTLYAHGLTNIYNHFMADIKSGDRFPRQFAVHQANYNAFLNAEPDAKSDNMLLEMKEYMDYYHKVTTFPTVISPSYRGGSNIATFSSMKAGRMRNAANLRAKKSKYGKKGSLYEAFGAVPGFKAKIAEGTLSSQLDGSRSSYYPRLITLIKQYFDGEPKTADNLAILKQLRATLYKDSDANPYFGNFEDYVDEYALAIDE